MWAAAQFGAGRNYMVSWNKMIYYLNGLWTAEPVAPPYETYKYAIMNRVDLLVQEVLEPGIPDLALTMAPPGFVFVTLYHSDTTDYRVAFYRPLYN
jgi:hypothetical protein